MTPGTEADGGGVMEPCAQHGDCRSLFCESGFCISTCRVELQNCPEGSLCFGSEDYGRGLCAKECEGDVDCLFEGQFCVEAPAPSQTNVCVGEFLLD